MSLLMKGFSFSDKKNFGILKRQMMFSMMKFVTTGPVTLFKGTISTHFIYILMAVKLQMLPLKLQ